ncbi:MAG: hypothetical protein GKR89_14390 [Candidatus Latescibacteria bacterium]|nr:hypothetical protein [Candidatus Latescibacterota bacterium]
MVTLYLVRHGQVYNPDGIIYGHLPGFGLSQTGEGQIERAGKALADCGPLQALYTSPLQRARESAAILAGHVGLQPVVAESLVETGIGGYQGKSFDVLPRPYITEEAVHEGIESAASIRARILAWVEGMQQDHAGQQIAAVSHRDPIIVALLHWTGQGLEALPDFNMNTGGVYRVQLNGAECAVELVV